MHNIINQKQLSFVEDKSYLYIVIVISEVVDEVKSKRKSGAIVKINFKKAYDSIF